LKSDFFWGALLACAPFFLFGVERVLSSRISGNSLAHYNSAFEVFLRATSLLTFLGMISLGWLNRRPECSGAREVLGEGAAFSLVLVSGALSFGPPVLALVLGPAFDPEVALVWGFLAPALGLIGLGQSGLSVVMVLRQWKWLVVSYLLMPLILLWGCWGGVGSAHGLARAVTLARLPDLICFGWAVRCSGGFAWKRSILPVFSLIVALLAPWFVGAFASVAVAVWLWRSGLWK
ncbi:MAG: hypothetical protein HUU04_09665, partial [Verrucomicrobiae bacterium]|nr:hypothetical protein [Verrucomicrobiae bacterium]